MSSQRLESATLDPNLDEGLEARVADPMWFLARQWQTGEFKGDDAANPLFVQLDARSVRIDRVVLPNGSEIGVGEAAMPLEPLVESESVREGPASKLVAAELGWMLVRSLRRSGFNAMLINALREAYPVAPMPSDPLDPAGSRRLGLLADASVDGTALESALSADPAALDPLIAAVGLGQAPADRLREIVQVWARVTGETFEEPTLGSTWNAERLEYEFEVSSTSQDGEVRLRANGYAGGRLDWYAFDEVADVAASRPAEIPVQAAVLRRIEVLPNPLRYRGMPAARFWEMEDGDVYFGHVQTGPEDLARVAVATYATVHGDDWFVVPLRVPLGTLTQVTRVTVIDDFGGVSQLHSTAVVDGGGTDRSFKFFELTGDRSAEERRSPMLFLPPTVETTDAGRALEDVRFLRDEAANLAWAVEQRIESSAGRPVDLAARLPAPGPASGDSGQDDTVGTWQLDLSTEVPANWVPLVPVRIHDDFADPDAIFGTVMLQRGRVAAGGDDSVGARGRVLIPDERLLIHEEEIPREGVRVVRRFQSTRDARGRLHTWVGRSKGPGRGAGDSGLLFDHLDRLGAGASGSPDASSSTAPEI